MITSAPRVGSGSVRRVIAAEITATSALKLSDGLTNLLPTVVVAIGYILVGTAAIAAIGMLVLKEPLTAVKVPRHPHDHQWRGDPQPRRCTVNLASFDGSDPGDRRKLPTSLRLTSTVPILDLPVYAY